MMSSVAGYAINWYKVLHAEPASTHTLQTVYNSRTTPQGATHVKETDDFIVGLLKRNKF